MMTNNMHTTMDAHNRFTIDCLSYWSHLTQGALERISVGMVPSMAPAFLLCTVFSAQVLPVAAHTSHPHCMFLFLF